MISIRGGSGLGDALYLQSVARYLVERGHQVEACCNWPDVFLPLAGKVKVSPFRRERIDRLAHYAQRRGATGTTQFEDCCIQAGIREKVDLRLDWQPVNVELIARLESSGKPVIVVQMPRAPFGRTDGYGVEFLPDVDVMQRSIDRLRGEAFIVQIGAGAQVRFDGRRIVPFEGYCGLDLDLADRTSVSDVIDVGYVADGFLGYCSFMVPLAESFEKPALFVWSRNGLKSRHEVVRQMTPQKVLHRASSRWVIDDCSEAELMREVDALCDQVGRSIAA